MADVASSEPAAPPVPQARPGAGRPESKAAGIYLYSLTAVYGETADLPAWTPRPDEYVLLTRREA